MKSLQEWAEDASAPRKTTSEKLGDRLQYARRAAGWTQVDLSVLLRRRGVKWSPAIVSLVENGDRHLRFTEAVVLWRLLEPFSGMTLEDLAEDVPVLEVDE